MAVIRDELVLVDRFSSVFSAYLNLGRQMSSTMTAAASSQEAFNGAVRQLESSSSGAASGQERMNRAMRSGSSAANGLISKIRGLAAAYLSLRSAQALIRLSDTQIQTTARLERMNDGMQTTPELQGMIFDSAQRSRGDYQETAGMAAQLGTLAGEAFNSSAEVVAFAEQINKQFALAGTNAQGAQAAMLQLTQAMSSGVLRGEELNSILEQAPTITKAISDYLGVGVGEMRELASQGKITSDVVKAAIFAAAEETNAAFEAIPLTFSQAWTMAKNEAVRALEPALQRLNGLLNSETGQNMLNGFIAGVRIAGDALVWFIDLVETGLQFIMDNWDMVSAILIGGAIAIAAIMTASAVQSGAAWAAANAPLLLLAGGIMLVIYMAQQMGYTWEEIGGLVGSVLYSLFALGSNLVADGWNLLASFAEFFANFLNDPVTAIAHLLADLADWALGILQSIASGIDAVFGSNLKSAVSGWRSGVQSWADSFGENEIQIARMTKIDYGDAWERGGALGRNIGKALDSFKIPDVRNAAGGKPFDYSAMLAGSGAGGTLNAIGADTKAIRNSVALSQEDTKLLVDLATREYVNNINLTAQTPVITINGQNTGDFDADLAQLEESLKKILLEQTASNTDLSYT